MHRVWVVEATLRPGQRHVHAKRRFYLDEDSWYALMVENYDARGELWHVNLAFSKNAYEVPTIAPVNLVFHDLIARSYPALGLRNNERRRASSSWQPRRRATSPRRACAAKARRNRYAPPRLWGEELHLPDPLRSREREPDAFPPWGFGHAASPQGEALPSQTGPTEKPNG